MGIGNKIKKQRALKNVTQSDLANALGVSSKTVSSWEIDRTEPNIGMIEKMCLYFNCLKTDLIGEDTLEFYYDARTKQMAQEIYENEELSLLFDAARDASPEDLKTVHTMLLALKKKEQ